jgi:hypothetical protein
MGYRRGSYRILERGHLEDLGVDGNIMLKGIFMNWFGVWRVD